MGLKFKDRAYIFIKMLQEGQYPNSTMLCEACRCSRNTAQRTIDDVRDKYAVPLEYDSSRKGYYLTRQDWTYPEKLPVSTEDFVSLLLARSLLSGAGLIDIERGLDSLWSRYCSQNSEMQRNLESFAKVFSSDSSVIADIADLGIIRLTAAAALGESVSFVYRSPWNGKEKARRGHILRVHYRAGMLYVLFHCETGKKMVLNAACISDYKILVEDIKFKEFEETTIQDDEWVRQYGVWASTEVEQIVIRILPPGSHYYATQYWYDRQDDVWDGDVLIRSFKAPVSPEIVRLVLSLGRHVESVEPQSLRESVAEELKSMVGQFII